MKQTTLLMTLCLSLALLLTAGCNSNKKAALEDTSVEGYENAKEAPELVLPKAN